MKDDGRVNPVDVTMSLAKGARMKGVNIVQGATVKDITTVVDRNRMSKRVSGVTTTSGHFIQGLYNYFKIYF